MVRVAINGFGRIGRLVLRAGIDSKKIEWVAINGVRDAEGSALLFKYDSVHGRFPGTVKAKKDAIVINGKEIKVFNERDVPEKLPWKQLKIDVLVESSGELRKKEDALAHIKAGAKRVVISAPAKGDEQVSSVVLGVNDEVLKKNEEIIDSASCTTNCLMPVLRVLNDNFKVKRAFMTTVHGYTNDQRVLDGSHKDLRRARAAALNIIPTSTGASKAAAKVIPELKGKVEGIALRVPVPNGSLIDLVAELEKNVSVEQVNSAMKKASETYLKGILEYTDDPIVSSDVIGNRHSSIFDAQSTMVLGGNMVKVLAWYDNELGYSQRIVDLIEKL
ncbi:MAG: glyceraldehyde 3-phosphate dehydrogenase [archaeon GW2011_AR10]|uniref:glyceraldehyde-3-phosphate dehydrogenase (NAD(P)(+)) (phosphorylating) n=1 Tax=Candidatus Iainarchaeum sp. TaxID=3101447 RepID=A0A7J4IUH0_9ARCH|nr:MAG: glyceraldehyde 3-phosphate dehydrogenase [archaeon GW2011_AR10]HIH08434.1 type I glyceraldehyde-3-phosphate dehydrogenase [Candidatus Diapherotrites archaeon]